MSDPSGNLDAEMGYLVLGWTPNGHFAPAADNAWLMDGWELVARLEGARVTPVDKLNPISFVGFTLGSHWEISPQLRVQLDVGLQSYSNNAELTNAPSALDSSSERLIVQLWATWRI